MNTLLDFSRIEAGRVRARFEPRRSRALTDRSRQHVPIGDGARPASSSSSTAAPLPSRSTSIARCGKRSSSTSSRTRSSSRSQGRVAVDASTRGRRRGARGAGHRRRHSRGRTAARLRAVPPRRGRAGPQPRGIRHRPGAGAGAGQAARRRADGRRASSGRAARSRSRSRSAPRICRRTRWSPSAHGRGNAGARSLYVRGSVALAAGRVAAATDPAASASERTPASRRPRRARSAGRRQRRHARLRANGCSPSAGTSTRSSNGREALDVARDRRPDVIVTDVMMPELDGFGLLRELRADPDLQPMPVIMLSARAGEEARIEGLAASADDYLVKPFSARDLLARVEAQIVKGRVRAIEQRHAQRLTRLFTHAPVAIAVLRGPEHRLRAGQLPLPRARSAAETSSASRSARRCRSSRGRASTSSSIASARTGEPYVGQSVRVALNRGPHGAPEDGYFDFVYQPVVGGRRPGRDDRRHRARRHGARGRQARGRDRQPPQGRIPGDAVARAAHAAQRRARLHADAARRRHRRRSACPASSRRSSATRGCRNS